MPDNSHYQICKNLIKLKIHCLVVKPLCDNIKEAKDLIRLARKNKVLGLVEFHKRFDQANILIKEHINKKNIGQPYILLNIVKKIIPEKYLKLNEETNVFQYLESTM